MIDWEEVTVIGSETDETQNKGLKKKKKNLQEGNRRDLFFF